ncbi:unnamed protein product (macronuclear) [Paramecium tetraurelia]|uniref:RING-type domain-containing protein n=1 Tax=Paramecium tetraurelia TaxID=5888 RepID=A0CCL0_PARTE|nr:uncharacterized protein GSPATT00037312001 [Paramecium tetraurelia]CAK68527.1 unnamed protein product [Paramecium tetraurelia]|eukprot:XP_001435924.1 hypothetical protein (macronuclear) [Paramecium tetraurelia strain d4-2]
MKNIRIPLFAYGTAIDHIGLKEIEESPQKYTQIQLDDSSFKIYICSFTELCLNILNNKNLILLVDYRELIEFDDMLQNIFDLIQFSQAKKVLCYIVSEETIKKGQWKMEIIKKYVEASTQKFNYPNYYQPNYNVQFIQSSQSLFNQLHFFQTTPKDIDFTKNNDALLQILSRNKNELEVSLIQGMVILYDLYYFENQTANNKPIQIIEIEGKVNYINSNEDKQVFRIKISDDTELKDQTFISNNFIQVKQCSPQIVFTPQFISMEKQQEFYMKYRDTSNISAIIGGVQYDIKNLEFCSTNYANSLKLTLSNSKFICAQEFQTSNKNFNINSQILIINKTTDDIIAFGNVVQDNFEISFTQKNNLNQDQKELEIFYLPLNDEDIIANVARGEQVQKGTHINKCRICMENTSNTLLIPCGHLRYCFDCQSEVQECLFCDTKIQSRKKLIVKQVDQNKNNLLKELTWRHQDLLKLSLQQNINIEQNVKINRFQYDIDFSQYYCQKCNKSKGTEFTICQQNHLLNHCLECSEQINECEFKGCKQKIICKGKIKYNFDE